MAHDSDYRKRVQFEQFRKKIEAAEGPGRTIKPKNLQPVPVGPGGMIQAFKGG